MEIKTLKDGSVMTVALSGRLDTTTAPDFEKELGELEGVSELILDFNELEYISSAGLRVLLSAQKKMKNQGTMKLTGVCDNILDVFEITGFSDILTIE